MLTSQRTRSIHTVMLLHVLDLSACVYWPCSSVAIFPFSSHIATMLKSQDYHTIVGGVQMAHILMEKLPDIFLIYFYREGVIHEIKALRDSPLKVATPIKTPPSHHQLPPMTSPHPTPPGPTHTPSSTRKYVKTHPRPLHCNYLFPVPCPLSI